MANNIDDFDPKSAVDDVKKKFEPTQLGKIIHETLLESKTADKAIRKIIIDLLKDDKQCREAVEKILKEADWRAGKQMWKAFGVWILSIVMLVIGALINRFL